METKGVRRRSLRPFIGIYTPNIVIFFLRTAGCAQEKMVRITLMYYVDFYSLFNHPEKDWEACLKEAAESPQMPSLFD